MTNLTKQNETQTGQQELNKTLHGTVHKITYYYCIQKITYLKIINLYTLIYTLLFSESDRLYK